MLVELHSPNGQEILVNSSEVAQVQYYPQYTQLNLMHTGMIKVQESFDTVVKLLSSVDQGENNV